MVAGADSIDEMALLRHGGMSRVVNRGYAPSTLGSFLTGLAATAPLLTASGSAGSADQVMIDIDDTIIEVHGYSKQGSGYGYSGVRGLNVWAIR